MLAIYGPRFSGTNEVSKRNWRTARIRRLRGRPLPVTWRETRREGISQSLPPETVVGEEVGDRLRRHPRSHTVGKPMQQVGRLCASQASGSAAEVPSASRQPVATVGPRFSLLLCESPATHSWLRPPAPPSGRHGWRGHSGLPRNLCTLCQLILCAWAAPQCQATGPSRPRGLADRPARQSWVRGLSGGRAQRRVDRRKLCTQRAPDSVASLPVSSPALSLSRQYSACSPPTVIRRQFSQTSL
jgi:hypothetical protein